VRSETQDSYTSNIINSNRWGDPEVEGRILCEKYMVTLHVIESNSLQATDNRQEPFLHQLISNTGSISAGEHNRVNYNDNNIVHIINKGINHFEPILNKARVGSTIQQENRQSPSDNRQPKNNVANIEPSVQQIFTRQDPLIVHQLPSQTSMLNPEQRNAVNKGDISVPGAKRKPEIRGDDTQGFELIQLLIKELFTHKVSPGGFESFEERFQSHVNQILSYLHSVIKEGYFPHSFFGGFSILLDTKIGKELNIEKLYFRFDTPQTLKVVIIREGQIHNDLDAINNIKLLSISEYDSNHQSHKFTSGELEYIIKENLHHEIKKNEARNIKDRVKDRIESRLVQVSKADIKNGIIVAVSNEKILDTSINHKFHEIVKGLWNNPEDDIAGLTSNDGEVVKRPLEKILKKITEVHSEYKHLPYADQAKEASHHAFMAGIFHMNFHYHYNLRVYIEMSVGGAYADIVLLPRGEERTLDSIPIIIELKAGTGAGTTLNDALEQAKGYAKKFQLNTMRVLTTSDNVLCVGLNFDSTENSKFQTYLSPGNEREIIPPTMQALLEATSGWNGEDNTKQVLEKQIQETLEHAYNIFPDTVSEEKGGNYFSGFLSGQVIFIDTFKDVSLTKFKFLYNENPLISGLRSRSSLGTTPVGAVTTFVLIKENKEQKKEVFIFHVREGGRGSLVNKKIGITNIGGIDTITQVYVSLKKGKIDLFDSTRYTSEQYGEYTFSNPNEVNENFFSGELINIPYPDGLKEACDEALNSQHISTSDQPLLNRYTELFKKMGEGIFPMKTFVTKESDTKAISHGVLSFYSAIRLQEPLEARALVLIDFQTGRGKLIDVLIHGIKFADQGGNAKEYIPVGLELKGPRKGKTVQALIGEADAQITREYKKGVTYKTLTDGDKVKFIGVVFNGEAKDSTSLIQSSENFHEVPVKHSSVFDIEQQRSQKKLKGDCLNQSNRKKRSTNNCLFSWEDIDKFNAEKTNPRDIDKMKINSKEFLTLIKNSQDESKNAQLIEFVREKIDSGVEGDYSSLLNKVVEDQGYERYVQNERIKSLSVEVSQHNGILTQNPQLKSRLLNAAGGIQLIRGIHGAIVSCKDGTATDCGLNIGRITWSFASQPIEAAMVKVTPQLIKHTESVAGKLLSGTLGKNAKFIIRFAEAKFGKTMARGAAGAVGGAFDIVDIARSTSDLIDCKNRDNGDDPCGEKEIRDNIATISFSGTSFISGVALTAAGMPVVGIAVGFGLMVGCGIYSGVSNIIEYEKKYDTTHGENWSIFWLTLLFQPIARDVRHFAARKDIVDSLTKEAWKVLSNSTSDVFAYGLGLGKVSFENRDQAPALRPDSAKILMNVTNANTKNLSRVIPDSIENAERICLPQITNKEYERDIKNSVSTAVHYCDNAMVIADRRRAKNGTIVYDLRNVDKGVIVGSNRANNNFLIFDGKTEITGGNNVVNRFVLRNRDFLGKIIGGRNSTNIFDLSQFADGEIKVHIDYRFKPNDPGLLKVKVNDRIFIDDFVSNNPNSFKYNYVGKQNKVDKILCTSYSEHFKKDDRDVIIDSGGGLNNGNKDIIENCKKVIISPYTAVKGEKSNYTFYVKTSGYKDDNLSSEINVKGTGTIVFSEIDLLSECDQITYSNNSNTLSLKIKLGQSKQFTLDIKNYVEKSSNKPNFVLIDKNGSNIIPKIEKSDSPTITIKSFELHTGCSQECSFNNFSSVENHYKKVLNNKRGYKVLSVVRDEIHKKECTTQHMVFGSLGDDIINFDRGTVFARGGNGSDVYSIDNNIESKEVNIDNKSEDKKLDILLMPEASEDFSIQGCDLHLNYNNTNVRVKNYFQDPDHKHLIIMNNKGEAFIPETQSISCSNSSSGNGKFAPFYYATQTRNMFLIPEDFQGDHVVINSSLEDIKRYKDKDDLLLVREREIPFVIKVEDFYINQNKWKNITCFLWNNNEFHPYFGLSQNISEVMNYDDKLRNDYEEIVKEYVIDFTQSHNISHNQKLEGGSVEQNKERIGVIILKNIIPGQINVLNNDTDLVLYDKESNNTVNIRNWDGSQSYRISTLEFDLGLNPIMIRKLDRFSLSNITDIQTLIDKASENYQNKAKYTSKVENDFKCLVSINGFENENKTYECLGFSSLQEQINFTENSCSLEQLAEFKEKTLNSDEILPLLRKLQNDLFLHGYSQGTIDQRSNLILIKEGSSQVTDKISSMVGNIEELAALHTITAASGKSLSKPKSTLNLSSCLGNRRKRDVSHCFISWEDIDKFNEEQGENEKRDVNKISINSEKFIDYVKDIADEDKHSQLIDLAGQTKVTGKFQNVINKVVRSKKVISHLNKIGRASGVLMHGMIAKMLWLIS
jgi:hypothetical protein